MYDILSYYKKNKFPYGSSYLDKICNALCPPSVPSLFTLLAETQYFLFVFVSAAAKKPKAALFLISVFL